MENYKKSTGNQGEMIAQSHYENLGYRCQDSNFTIRGGELDRIMTNDTMLVILEVKVVNSLESIHDYLTPKKLSHLKHSIDSYLWKYPTHKQVRLDVVFIKHNRVCSIVEAVEL